MDLTLGRPERGLLHLQALRHLPGRTGRERHAREGLLHLPVVQHQARVHGHGAGLGGVVADVRLHHDDRPGFRHFLRMDEDAAAGHMVHQVGIGDIGLPGGNQPAVAVDAAVVGEIQHILGLARRVGAVVAVVGAHGDHDGPADRDAGLLKVQHHRQVAAGVLEDRPAVDEDLAAAHDGLEVQEEPLAGELRSEGHVLAVPGGTLVVAAAAALGGDQRDRVREVHHLPGCIVKAALGGTFGISLQETPSGIEIEYFPAAAGDFVEAGRAALLRRQARGKQQACQDRGHSRE